METNIDWLTRLFNLIDARSFSSVWYWMALAVVWSTASHFVLGVPFDLVQRARRDGGQAARDMENLVRINVNRMTYIDDSAGVWLIGIGSFLLTTLGTLGFYYGFEFAQAVFLIAAPLTLVGILSLREARQYSLKPLSGEPLRRRLGRLRIVIQIIGMVAIFVTALWGMYQNLVFDPLQA